MRAGTYEVLGEGLMRQRVDGHKFEDEFSSIIGRRKTVIRLHTPNTGYAGLVQPSDFIVIGNTFSFVETKETGKDTFSISDMEQLDSMRQFVEEKFMGKGQLQSDMQYLVIVHFIKRSIIRVMSAEYAFDLLLHKKTLRYDDANTCGFSSLKELEEKLYL